MADTPCESWRWALRACLAALSGAALSALRDAAARDDSALIQGATTTPPPLHCFLGARCERACPLGYAGLAEGLETVEEVERAFGALMREIYERTGDERGPRDLVNWIDDTPRAVMLAEIQWEADRELLLRERAAAAPATGGVATCQTP